MKGVDTNVLVRYLAQDDAVQAGLATRLIESFTPADPGFVATVVLVETVWVLARSYGRPKSEILSILEGLLRARELRVEDIELHLRALQLFARTNTDYADAVIAEAGRRAGCEATVTFDLAAAGSGLMERLEG